MFEKTKGREILQSDRVILHSDLNACYASIECVLNHDLRGKPVAVGGSAEARHGIILAKSQEAKECGVKTGETLWQAKLKCPRLIIVEPHFEQYMRFSRCAHEIYLRYTDLVEPFGLDECWLDVTGSTYAFGSGVKIANEIRQTVKKELGLTVSVGVSFNKIFAKLGSDMKKPDAVTDIGHNDFKEKIWRLPASDLLGVGRATAKRLESCGILTIGDIAKTDAVFLRKILGKCDADLWVYANGLDSSRVKRYDFTVPAKSIGHGVTCKADLVNAEEVWEVMLSLAQDISRRLKESRLAAKGVQISIKDNQLVSRQFQAAVSLATQSALEIAAEGFRLFKGNYDWKHNVRAVTVRAIELQSEDTPDQLDLFGNSEKHDRQEKIDNTVIDIRRRFGDRAIFNCCLMTEKKIPHKDSGISVLPSPMFK